MTTLTAPIDFQWVPQPQAQAIINRLVQRFVEQHPFIKTLKSSLRSEAGIRLIDNIDFIRIAPAGVDLNLEDELRDVGFEGPPEAMFHPGGVFPIVRVMDGAPALGVKVDSVSDFAATHQLQSERHGFPGSRFRWLVVENHGVELHAVERHGWASFESPNDSVNDIINANHWYETFRTRVRDGAYDEELFNTTSDLIERAKNDLHIDWVCDLFFAAERDYWMRRNQAAQTQYARQQRVGIGWANHDHHTYRCSRENIHLLVGLLESLGMICRESFTPGSAAGWGAQVLEQPVTHIIVFADVDMSPEELKTDFAHLGLDARKELGTVGLWCGLHGDSIHVAGMHHLECVFDFDNLADQLLAESGIEMMAPFSNYDHLKQQFTKGQVWQVTPSRLDQLHDRGQITAEQRMRFLEYGALGSHMENLERNDGFKGFNQVGITHIIDQTDPRLAAEASVQKL